MTTTAVINLSCTAVALAVGIALIWYFARSLPPELEQAAATPADTYQGPNSLQLMEDLDAHLDAYAASIDGLYEEPSSGLDPELAAGLQRLRAAVHDHRNTLEGGK